MLSVLLRCYPARFRNRFGDELIRATLERYRANVGVRGRTRAVGSLLLDVVNVVISGFAERLWKPGSSRGPNRHNPNEPQGRKDPIMSTLIQDLRFAIRTLAKQPVFAAIVVLTVALGVGANTAMFSIVYGVLLRPLPYEDPAELVIVYQTDRFNNTTLEGASGPDYFDYLEMQTVFERMAAWTGFNPTLADGLSDPERITVTRATRTLFATLGWQPVVGRGFLADEDQPSGPLVTVLSHGLWTTRFGSDPNIIGNSIQLDGGDYTVIGVMPKDFQFNTGTQAWVPLQYGPTTASRGQHNLFIIARLKDNVSVDAARTEMNRVMANLEQRYPDDNIGRGANVQPLDTAITGTVRPALLILMGAVGLVLLLACANVANLLFTRGTARQREIAVRAALGAGRGRLVSQLLTESVVLATLGGVFAVVFAFGGIQLIRTLNPASVPRLSAVSLSPAVLGFTLLLTVVTGLLFGTVPALQASRPNLNHALSEGGRTSSSGATAKLRSTLAVAQIAIAFVLVVGAGLLIKSMWNLTRVDPGFRHENLVRLSVSLPVSRYPNNFRDWPNVPEVHQFYDEVFTRAARIPGVTHVALALNSPTNSGWTTRVAMEGGPQTVAEGVEEERIRPVSHGYFETIGTPIVQGRALTRFDRGDAPPVAVVNESFVNKYLPHENPIGQRFQFWGALREIVGVVPDVKFMGVNAPTRPAFYPPLAQVPFSGFDVILQTNTPPNQTIAAMRTEINAIDRDLAVFNTASFADILSTSLAPQRFNLVMLGIFAGIALVLASVGIYGVIAYGVSRRVHEFGVRMSLGADSGTLSRLVLSQGSKLAGIGIAIGLAGAIGTSKLISGLLFNVAPSDPTTLATVAGFLVVVALAATLIPARRASRVDPVTALRQE